MRARLVTVTALMIVTVLCSGYTAWTFIPQQAERLNVLIISMCSFRFKMLQEYNGGEPSVMPAMDRFFATSSYIFSNVFNGMPWTAIFSTAQTLLPRSEIESLRYTQYVNSSRNYIIRVPHRQSWLARPGEEIDDNDYEKNIAGEVDYIKRTLKRETNRPFFLLAHFKYMHYPLIDRFNADSEWDYYLTDAERQRVAEYVRHPGRYPEKLPFLLLLTNSDEVPVSHPRIQKEINVRAKRHQGRSDKAYRFKGLLSDPSFIAEWKKSPGFAEDMQLLTKIYKGNARYLDKVLGPMMNLWGDPELQRNTLVVVTGDHGEMHMEHDMLTHAYALYDDVLRIPLAVRFPGEHKPVRITEQTHFQPVVHMIRGVVNGGVDEENFLKSFTRVKDDAVILRNCMNTKRGLRYKNKYKYIFEIAEDRATLYDLEKDPGETTNIADQHPELVDKFEAMFWQLYPEFKTIDHGECVDSEGGGES